MGWIAVVGVVFSFLVEVLKLVVDVRADRKKEKEDVKKQKTEALQSVLRGIVDGDDSRVNDNMDRLRRLRQK